MSRIVIELINQTPVEQQRTEFVERKGIGHADSICDVVMEEISLALCFISTRIPSHSLRLG